MLTSPEMQIQPFTFDAYLSVITNDCLVDVRYDLDALTEDEEDDDADEDQGHVELPLLGLHRGRVVAARGVVGADGDVVAAAPAAGVEAPGAAVEVVVAAVVVMGGGGGAGGHLLVELDGHADPEKRDAVVSTREHNRQMLRPTPIT